MRKRRIKEDLNLLEAYLYKPSFFEVHRENIPYVAIPIIFLIIVILICWLGFYNQLEIKKSELSNLQKELSEIEKDIKEVTETSDYNTVKQLQNQINNYEIFDKNLNSYPDLSEKVFLKICEVPEGVNIKSIEYDNLSNTLTVTYEADNQEIYPILINDMRNSGLFSDVYYNGYKGVDKVIEVPTHSSEESNSNKDVEDVNDNTEINENDTEDNISSDKLDGMENQQSETALILKEYESTVTYKIKGDE